MDCPRCGKVMKPLGTARWRCDGCGWTEDENVEMRDK
jgi:tRNA(Ile2) C34 agmatinyltransferase TiaS